MLSLPCSQVGMQGAGGVGLHGKAVRCCLESERGSRGVRAPVTFSGGGFTENSYLDQLQLLGWNGGWCQWLEIPGQHLSGVAQLLPIICFWLP